MSKLIVIGNGFDLTVGARTSYYDFFESDFYKDTKDTLGTIMYNFKSNQFVYLPQYDNIFNCWDLLFYIESKKNKVIASSGVVINWCDVEKVIFNSFFDNNNGNLICWKHIYEKLHYYYESRHNAIRNMSMSNDDYSNILIRCMIEQHWESYCNNSANFYEKLLKELNNFEKKFGLYIKQESSDSNYLSNAQKIVNKLNDLDDKIIIDSFNYSDFSDKRITIRHINGDCRNPIFGIDLNDDTEKRYPHISRFTKTNRRIYQDAFNLNDSTVWKNADIDSALIYGHSLNRMDYDYFNYLFTLLGFHTFDIDKMGSIEFAYKVYDQTKKDEIRNNYAESIYSLLNYYESYVSKTNQHILVNLLRFSGKFKIIEL